MDEEQLSKHERDLMFSAVIVIGCAAIGALFIIGALVATYLL